MVAEDDATARHLASTYGHWVHSIRAGGGAAEILDPDTAAPLTPDQRRLVEDRLATQFVGSPATVVERLGAFLDSHRLLAEAWGLLPAARDGHARTGAAVTP
ncbi:monooxygenase-like protein [Mycobacteroides abscessus subsp. abscessus]|nr:monooxygenase-like protein [Mycobacteroides abscessus subsp. abscessus]